MLSTPGWIPGSMAIADSRVYRDARESALQAEASMAQVPRLGLRAKLGTGSHCYRIGGAGEHAPDKRLVALRALEEVKRKNWWKTNKHK